MATVQVEVPLVAAKRVVRKTLSRKSPFLPEVLPSLINYGDITYCKENGQNVLLGEGSFGQASSLPVEHLLHSVIPGDVSGQGSETLHPSALDLRCQSRCRSRESLSRPGV